MPPTPSCAPEEKVESEKMSENSTPNDREEVNDEEVEKLANALVANLLGHSAGGTDKKLASTLNPDDPPCDGCKSPNFGTMRCGSCSSAFYCSTECQVSHWSEHKRECKRLQKRNEKVAERVLENFENDIDGWGDLDATGAYRAAVRLGLCDKIREVLALDKVKIVERHRYDHTLFYSISVMGMLFLGQRAEGQESRKERAPMAVMDGVRVGDYVSSHPDALDVWLEASVQLLRDIADPTTLRYPDLYHATQDCADDVWAMWVMVFANSTAAPAVLLPFPQAGDNNGVESAAQRRKRGEDHVREIVKTLGEARQLVEREWNNISVSVRLVCALVFVRAQEYGVGIDVGGAWNLNEEQKKLFHSIEIPLAIGAIEKGTALSQQDAEAVFLREWHSKVKSVLMR